jgi:ATP-dependent helicase HepA
MANIIVVPRMLVELPGRKGIGKLESTADGRCAVTIFHSILHIETIALAPLSIGRAYLSRQTRVYVRIGDRFRVGRVTNYLMQENGLVDYEVRFPNGKQSDFCEVEIFVRPWDAPEDPAEILAAGGAESQFLHDRAERSPRA